MPCNGTDADYAVTDTDSIEDNEQISLLFSACIASASVATICLCIVAGIIVACCTCKRKRNDESVPQTDESIDPIYETIADTLKDTPSDIEAEVEMSHNDAYKKVTAPLEIIKCNRQQLICII